MGFIIFVIFNFIVTTYWLLEGIFRVNNHFFYLSAMQEEVLKLVLLALEDGSALSRKVLVMFVVQRLESHFPQASKTSIGHVVQLLYRASCFKVKNIILQCLLLRKTFNI